MTTSFQELKRNRKLQNEKLAEVLEKQNAKQGSYKDDRYWTPTVDKNGNGSAIIRFLPPAVGEDIPYVQLFSHSFQGPSGLWYIENSRSTLKQDDPLGKYNSLLWNQSTDDQSPGRKQARRQKRKLNFISNILVISDKANPDTEGKNYLYKYGKKIFDKVNDKMNPGEEFEDVVAFNPFDFWEGADFRIIIRQVDGYRNFDKSLFDPQSPLFGDDDAKKEELWNKLYSLTAEIAPDKFKSYAELEAQMNKVLLLDGSSRVTTKTDSAEDLVEKLAAATKEKKSKLPPVDLAETEDIDDLIASITQEDD